MDGPGHSDRRVLAVALSVLLLLAAVDAVSGIVLVSTLGVVVVVVGLVAAPRTALLTGGVALALGLVLVATVDRGDLAPLRVGNIVVGTLIAWGGATARTRREARHREDVRAHEEEAMRLRVVEQEHRRMFDELQEALQPPLPTIPGFAVDVAYLPAGSASPSGGDLHEVHRLDDGRSALLLVDVMGHGVASTRDALRVVSLARVLIEEGVPLAQLPEALDRRLNRPAVAAPGGPAPAVPEDDVIVTATVVALVLDPEDGSAEVVCGGHPPPLLLRADGTTSYVDSTGPTIGYPPGATSTPASLVLGAGDALVLYTDGLVEGTRDLVAGMARLQDTAAAVLASDAGDPALRLVEAMGVRREARDDVLVLVLQRRGGPSSDGVERLPGT